MANQKPWVVGIDYSMTCPSISYINRNSPFKFEHVVVNYLNSSPPKKGIPNITGTRLQDYISNEQRFHWISEWAIQIITTLPDAEVFIEDYSYGSKGKVFHIAENTGVLKHKLYRLDVPITPVPPTVIKQFATGKGNADKDKMYAAFLDDTGVDLMAAYQPKAKKVGSPVGDIVDSYFICKYGIERG